VGLLCSCSGGPGPAAGTQEETADTNAQGVLKVGQVEHQLKHVYFDHRDELVLVMVTDRPIPEDMEIYGNYMLAEAGEVAGLTASIDKESWTLAGHLDTVFHPTSGAPPDDLGEGAQIEILRHDAEVIEARLHLDEAAETGDVSHTFDVTFTISAFDVFEPMEATVKGVDSEPATAYASFINAVFAIDPAEAKRWCSVEQAAKLDSYDDIHDTLDKVRSMHPKEITVLSTEISGDTATLQVEGERKGVLGTATVAMVLEDGAWKVNKEKWEYKKE
jgi:hypothetical protein